ncbi:MAG TPA: potassium transporter, partial [Planctomycetaceae bacterium]|nr:potassium transporter [Planctomycetaceae bacterium]
LQTERDRKAALDAAIDSATQRLTATQAEIAAQAKPPQLPDDATDLFDPLPLETLRKRRSDAEASLNAARQNRQSLEDIQRERISRSANLTNLIAEARTAAAQAAASVIGELADDPQGTLLAAREKQRLITIAAARQRLETLLAEQAMIDAESELLPLQIEAAVADVQRAEAMLKLWTDLLGRQKQFRIEGDLAEFKQQASSENLDVEESLLWPLADRWLELVRTNAQIQRDIADNRTRFDNLDATYKEVSTEIDRDLESNEGLRSGLGLKLLRIRSRLPSTSKLRGEIRDVDQKIEQSRQFQTEIDLVLDAIGESANGRASGREISSRPAKGTLASMQRSLLMRMMADTDEHISDLIELKSVLELKRRISTELRQKIETNVIWIRDATTFRISSIPSAWASLQRIFSRETLRPAIHSLVEAIPRRLDLCLIWILSAAIPWAFSGRLRTRLQALNQSAKIVNQRPLMSTVFAIVITLVLALPLVATLAVAGALIADSIDNSPVLIALGTAFQASALLILPMRWLRQLMKNGGVAQSHFNYETAQTEPARTALARMTWFGVPLCILWVLASNSSISQGESTLSRLLFVIGMVVLAGVFWRALDPETGIKSQFIKDNPDGWLARLRWLWHGLALSPLILASLSLAGYTYAATLLSQRLYWSLWFVIAIILLGGMIKRWVQVRRTLRIQETEAISAQSSSSITTSPDDAPIAPPPTSAVDAHLAFAEIDAQTLRLLSALLWVTILFGAAWLWAPVLPAVRFLERVPLWDTTAVDGSIVSITLANLVVALPIIFLTWVSARNVPGLVETTLLERLPLDKPARYAITSLASYAIVILGIIFSAQAIGLRWDGIQWLVAALGVGLGFGLQEIFANFVSGLILLFEQPIRVGDVVTIGNTTGTVSKIRMRATIVTNWDRQELIIPNKTLITERLINWTLTDSTNRLELHIGVAYETDTRVACRLLEEICAQHEHILVDPKPVIVFEGFGDSTLKIVIRCFLSRLDLRLPTLHELNTTINERFKEAGIEIAFPQQDLHIRSIPAQWEIGKQAAEVSKSPVTLGARNPIGPVSETTAD